MSEKRKGAQIVVAAGITAALSVGQIPAVAFAEASEGQPQQEAAGQQDSVATAALTASSGDTSSASVDPEAASAEMPSFVSLIAPQPSVATAGSVMLPDTVIATYDDGSSSEVPVVWFLDGAAIDTVGASKLAPGAYSFTGFVEGANLDVTYDVDIAAPVANEVDVQSNGSEESDDVDRSETVVKAAGSQNIQVDGVAWAYDASFVIPVGFDPEFHLFNGLPWEDLNVTFTNEAGEAYDYHLASTSDRDFSGVDTSKPGEYDASFTVSEYDSSMGDLAGVRFPVHFTVVNAAEIPTEFNATADVQTPDPSYMPYIDIPYSISLSLENGDSVDAMIVWDEEELDAVRQSIDTPGTYVVHGHYAGAPEIETTATIWVQGIRSVQREDVYTEPGKAPVMPGSVYVEYEDGSVSSTSVEWEEIDSSQYAEKNVFEVKGVVANTDIIAVAEVYVSELIEVISPRIITTPGNLPSDWMDGVSMRYELGTEIVYPTWDFPEIDDPRLSQPGTLQIHGTAEGYDYDFTCNLVVVDVDSYQAEYEVSTCPGILNLPYSITITTPEGDKESLTIQWRYPSGGSFDEVGEYDVTGVIRGTSLSVVAHVDVMNVTEIRGISKSYSTIEGVLPQLPQSANLVLEDNSTVYAGVSWQMPMPETFTTDASPVVVNGRLSNGDTVSTEVNVLWTQPVRDEVRVSTLVGIAPQLLYSMTATMSDGTRRNVNVQWETPDPQQYAQAGSSFQVNGYIKGSDYPVVANVAVCNPSDDPVWTSTIAEGATPAYPAYAPPITLDNGDEYSVPYNRLEWKEADPAVFKAGETIEIAGTILGSPATVKGLVSVVKATSLANDSFHTDYLVLPHTAIEGYLPTYAQGLTEDGQYVDIAIEWNAIDPGAAENPGVIEVEGSAAGMPVTCQLRVVKPKSAVVDEPIATLSGVDSIESQTYDMTLTCDDGSGSDIYIPYTVGSVDWDASADILSTPGTHQISGASEYLGDGIVISATLEVYAEVVSVEELTGWAIPDGYTSVPYEVEVTLGNPDTSPLAALASMFSGERAMNATTATMHTSWTSPYYEWITDDNVGETMVIDGYILEIDYPITCDLSITRMKTVSAPSVSTAPGAMPQLPTQVVAELENGMTVPLYVNWDWNIDPSAYETPGSTFEIKGYAGGSDPYEVSCIVTVEGVQEVAEESTEALMNLVSEVGAQPVLPGIVPVSLTDGTIGTAAVDWDWGSVDETLFNQVGAEFDVSGTVRGIGGAARLMRAAAPGQITAHVKIVGDGESSVSYIDPTVTTVVSSNIEAENLLPTYCTVTLSNGDVRQLAVEWDASSVDLTKPGTYMVKGVVDDTDKTAYAYVTVASEDSVRAPVSADAVKIPIEIPEGGLSLAELSQKLPVNVVVNYTQGASAAVPVSWILDGVSVEQLAKPGTITVKGNIEGIPSIEAVATIELVEDISSVIAPVAPVEPVVVETHATFAPTLPETVEFAMTDGSSKELGVTWGAVSSTDYFITGEFTVRGVVDEYGIEVEAMVKVLPYVAVDAIEIECDQIDENDVIRLEKGQISKLDVSVLPEDATFKAVTFSSSDPAVVEVAQDGTLTAKSDGTAVIAIEADGMSARISVVVGTEPTLEVPASTVAITGEGIQGGQALLSKGSTLKLDAVVAPDTTTDKTITWSSSDPAVATVSEGGLVTAVRGGSTTITATAASGAHASIMVTVPRTLETVGLEIVNPDACRIELGGTFDVNNIQFQMVEVYDDGSRFVTPIAAEHIEVLGSVDVNKAGTYTLSAAVVEHPEVACEFTVIVWDPNGIEAPSENPASDGKADETVKPLKTGDDADKLAGTGDNVAPAVGGVAATGLVALIGAWFARGRGRDER